MQSPVFTCKQQPALARATCCSSAPNLSSGRNSACELPPLWRIGAVVMFALWALMAVTAAYAGGTDAPHTLVAQSPALSAVHGASQTADPPASKIRCYPQLPDDAPSCPHLEALKSSLVHKVATHIGRRVLAPMMPDALSAMAGYGDGSSAKFFYPVIRQDRFPPLYLITERFRI